MTAPSSSLAFFTRHAAKGFDFLGFHCCPVKVSDAALSRRDATRLYERGASNKRIARYLARWLGWATMALGGFFICDPALAFTCAGKSGSCACGGPSHGVCVETNRCQCVAGWMGAECEFQAYCGTTACPGTGIANGVFSGTTCNYPSGICTVPGISGKCICIPGKTGACCELDSPALNGTVTPSALDFGTLIVGNAGIPQVITFSNTLDAATPIAVANIALGGSNPGDFSLGGTCAVNASVSGGQSCTITVTFTPGALGSRSATLTVNTSTTTLTGSGTTDTRQIVLDPTTPTTLYAALDGGGVYKKVGAADWAAANGTTPTNLSNLNVKALAISSSGTTLFAGTDGGGVFKSADSGDTWAACANTGGGMTNLNLRSLALTGTTLYAGTTAGVFTSADDCSTWAAMSAGLP